MPTASRHPHHEDVVPGRADSYPEFEGGESALLRERRLRLCNLCRGLKRKFGSGATPVQVLQGNGAGRSLRIVHGIT